ncbi:hypothetical protein [Acidaminococcus intestini]|jgi:hypothetical protein|uniref:hypothetical protein n=1 Tax=Acidaminococcus intestini TaxID=187327 RepID=UPI00206D8FBB|nr:hypothetical protein [Acidaminococcus intestini]DAH03772.1 MAG TPA: hypothetical protein [Caudoviricetes sp.]
MNGTNVDYYVSGFDTAGKRVGSIICDFDPNKDENAEKLAALKERGKTLFKDAAVVDVVSASDYNQYLTGEYVRGADGQPTAYVAPEPTADEQKAKKQAEVQSSYESDKEALMKYYLAASLAGDADTQNELRTELTNLDAQFDADMRALNG